MINIKSKVYLGLQSGGSGELLKTGGTPVYYGDMYGSAGGTPGVSSYATGGTISYVGTYRLHTFTPANDGAGVFQVDSAITNAKVLIVAGGGGGCQGGGGGGEVYYSETLDFSASTNYNITVGEGGAGIYVYTATGGVNGGNSSVQHAAGTVTCLGGGGGGAWEEDGDDGGCGGGGGGDSAIPPGTTYGGSATGSYNGEDGRGNGAYVNSYSPAGGGGGAGGKGSYPSGVQTGGNGGVGYSCDITGSAVKYGGGGGGGVNGYGYGGDGKDGGGDGKPRGGGNGQAGTDGRGGGGGGAGYFANGGDGGDGIIIIAYEDAVDHDFEGWTETAGTGHVFLEESDLCDADDDGQACKLTSNATLQSENETVTAANWVIFGFYGKGDGTNGITYTLYDVTNTATIKTEEVLIPAFWDYHSYKFQVPTGCASMYVKFETNSSSGVFIDEVSLYDWGVLTYTECTDVQAKPSPTWSYGFNSNEPDDNVAGTGMAKFQIENTDGQYSPDHASALGTFEEGMPIKIQIESTDLGDTNVVENSGFEDDMDADSSGYGYIAKITIDNTKVADDHTNFPVMIQGTYDGTGGEPDLRDTANGGDIQNVDATGTITGADDVPADLIFSLSGDGSSPLSYEVELYDKTTGDITLWVKIPTMDADTDLDFYMLYGNSAVTTSQEDINNVWTNYEYVSHMSVASGNLKDSSGNNSDTTKYGTPLYRQTGGPTGYSIEFDGSTDYFADTSISFAFHAQNSDTNWMIICDLDDNNTDQYLLLSGIHDGAYMRVDDSASQAAFWKIDDVTDDDYGTGTTGMYSAGWKTWHQDIEGGVDHRGYMDGVLDYNGAVTSVDNLHNELWIGRRDESAAGYLDGHVCEVRARQAAGDADYILTEHNSLNSGFYTMGSAVTRGLDDFAEWTSHNGGVYEETTTVYNGSRAVKFIGTGTDTYLSQWVKVEPDLEYALTFYAYEDYFYKVYDRDNNLLDSGDGDAGASWTLVTDNCSAFEVAEVQIQVGVFSGETGYIDDVALTSRETNYTRTKFYGIIDSITPTWRDGYPVTDVVCLDWMGQLAAQETGGRDIATSKRADEAVDTLLDALDDAPTGRILDTCDETFDYVFKNISTDGMDRAIYQLAWNEGGYFFAEGNGVANLRSGSARDSSVSQFTIDETMEGFDISYDANDRYNVISLQFNVKDPTATTTVWQAPVVGLKMAANATTIFSARYRDPEFGKPVWCSAVTEPAGADKVFSGGAGTNCVATFVDYGDYAQVTVVNSGAAETLDTYNIKGTALLERNPITYIAEHTDSIAQIGRKQFDRKFGLLDDPAVVKERAEAIRDKYAPSHIGGCTIRVLANQDATIAKQMIEAEPETRFTVTQSETGMSSTDFIIRHITYQQDDTLLWVDIEADIA